MVSQRDHHINGHRVNVELALPLINDSLYEQDIVVPNETWMEKVQRKLQFAIPDQVKIYRSIIIIFGSSQSLISTPT